MFKYTSDAKLLIDYGLSVIDWYGSLNNIDCFCAEFVLKTVYKNLLNFYKVRPIQPIHV